VNTVAKIEKKRPLHEIILQELQERILSGEWPPGHALPHEVDLAKSYGCSRMTASKALNTLVQAGLIERRRRAGSRVAQPRAQSAVLAIPEIEHEVRSMGMEYGYVLLNRTRRTSRKSDAPGFAASSRLPVLELSCLHLAGGRPFCLENRLISLAEAPEAATESFESVAPGPWLLHQVPWSNASHKIRAIAADARTALLLRLEEGAPCLVVERETSLGGRSVTSVQLTYPGESHELTASFTPTDGK
jgi:Transcriptional regulators